MPPFITVTLATALLGLVVGCTSGEPPSASPSPDPQVHSPGRATPSTSFGWFTASDIAAAFASASASASRSVAPTPVPSYLASAQAFASAYASEHPPPSVVAGASPPPCDLRAPICQAFNTPAPFAIEGGDADAERAIADAVAKTAALRSYRFAASVTGGRYLAFDRDEYSDWRIAGSLARVPKLNLTATLTAIQPAVFGQQGSQRDTPLRIVDDAWQIGPSQSPVAPASKTLAMIWLPDQLVAREVRPFAAGYAAAGEEARDRVAAIRYHLAPAGVAAYQAVTWLGGAWTGDVWIARDGGYVVSVRIHGAPPADSPYPFRPLDVQLDIHDANDPAIVTDLDQGSH